MADTTRSVFTVVLHIGQTATAALTGWLACGVHTCDRTNGDEQSTYAQQRTDHRSGA
jgi:hypothetical protein